jgi:hypothetical protein
MTRWLRGFIGRAVLRLSSAMAPGRAARFQRGAEGEPVPPGELVLRVSARKWLPMDFPENRQVNPLLFKLSSSDERADPPHLSVFAEKLTTSAQAWELLGAKPEHSIVVRLNVDEVRALQPSPECPGFLGLDVIWTQALVTTEGVEVPDDRPGADGHAGIIRSGVAPLNRTQRSDLRSKLADLASKNVEFIPEAMVMSGDGDSVT